MSVEKESTTHIAAYLTDRQVPSFSYPNTSPQKPRRSGCVCSGWGRRCPHALSSSSLRVLTEDSSPLGFTCLTQGYTLHSVTSLRGVQSSAPHLHAGRLCRAISCWVPSGAGVSPRRSFACPYCSGEPSPINLLHSHLLRGFFPGAPGLRQHVTSWLRVSFSFLMFHKIKVWLTTDGILESIK